MFGHLPELVIILVIALIVFGPEKLPEVAANAGKMVREVRAAMDTAMTPEDVAVEDEFSSYYYDSLARSGEDDELYGEPEVIGEDGEEAVLTEHGPMADAAEHDAAGLRAEHPEVPGSDLPSGA